MAVVNINTIKNWFKTAMIPTQDQFWSVFDSYRHKNDNIPVAEVDGINELLATRASQQVLDNHLAHKGAPNGYAPLNISGKVPDANLPLKVVSLTTPTGVPADGDEWILYTL